MKAIHLIQKDPDLTPEPIEKGSRIYKSGYWDLTVARAKELVGKKIYFHKAQKEKSFFGGIIKGCRVKEDAPWKGRIIFTLEAGKDFKGKKADGGKWSMEMMFVE